MTGYLSLFLSFKYPLPQRSRPWPEHNAKSASFLSPFYSFSPFFPGWWSGERDEWPRPADLSEESDDLEEALPSADAPRSRFCVYVFHRDNVHFPFAHEAIRRMLRIFHDKIFQKMSRLRRANRDVRRLIQALVRLSARAYENMKGLGHPRINGGENKWHKCRNASWVRMHNF